MLVVKLNKELKHVCPFGVQILLAPEEAMTYSYGLALLNGTTLFTTILSLQIPLQLDMPGVLNPKEPIVLQFEPCN